MGLKKHVTLSNGVQLNYHRIAVMTQHVNVATILEVQSYTSKAKRVEEKAALAANQEAGEVVVECDVYVEGTFYNIPYDAEMTIPGAYNYLKGLSEFEGATDVLELDAEEPTPEPTPEPEPEQEPEQEQGAEPTQEESEGGE